MPDLVYPYSVQLVLSDPDLFGRVEIEEAFGKYVREPNMSVFDSRTSQDGILVHLDVTGKQINSLINQLEKLKLKRCIDYYYVMSRKFQSNPS